MDIELYYEEKGTGEPFIFLHGNGEDGSYFRYQTEYFQSKYRVIALDTRGHGKSPRGEAPFTIEQFSCDLYDFMQAQRMADAVILGRSQYCHEICHKTPRQGEGVDFERRQPGCKGGKAENADPD